ncbi:PAS domain S-box protein [Luteolibacter sp. SL250]|uniref:sensor histidine kinase n=1 Tax=Luteolibacter sp. SL250 TaxID=2995170 RepID=UPI002270F684|nr:PAS domain S-box protein [Luteolibacter sp. SL250]WAC20389.1 PAS domain S-box protein [Luteolibacter sp. SL250]
MDSHTGGIDALSGSAEWFRLLFERSTDAMNLMDPETMEFVAGNEAFFRATGLPPEKVIGRTLMDICPEYQADGRTTEAAARETMRLAMEKGSHRTEWLTRRGDGVDEFIDVVATSLPSGGRTLILSTARNIDGSKRMEAELRLSETRWHRVFEQIPMSMQIFAPDGSTRQVNRAFGELFQLIMEDLKDFNILQDHQLEEAGHMDKVRRAFGGEVSVIPPIPFQLKTAPDQEGKGVRWIGSTMFPVFDPAGRIIEVVCVHEDHTARKIAEDEVRQLNQTLEQRIAERTAELVISEERFKQLFRFSPLGMAQVDEQARFQQANPAFCELVGYDISELGEMSYWDITPERYYDGQRSSIEALGRTGRFGPFDKEYIHKDGRRIPVRLNGVRVVSSTGEVQVWGIAEDISARHAAESALRESEEKFKALFEFSPLGMARVNWEGDLIQVNESFGRMIGYTPEEATALSYWDITPRKYEEQEKLILELVAREGRFGPFEKEYIHRDGHLVPIVINGMKIRGLNGEDELWGIVEDITPRRQAEQAIRESEKKFRTLFESSSQGVMLHDENHRFSEVNPAAAKILGRAPEDFIGIHPSEIAPEYQANGELSETVARREIGRCLETGLSQFEWTHCHKDGHELQLEVTLNRIPHGEKNIMQAFITDISARKHAEMELKRSLERERELNQLKSNFVSMVSHEFRTPLGIIQSSAEILDDYLDQLEAAERGEQLQSIIKNSRRMAGLMEDVLLLGRLDSGRMEFVPRPLDLAALFRRLVDEVRSTTDARRPIEFSTTDLPEEAMADERLLRHILLNLLNNAVKYSPDGTPVTFRASATDGLLRFVIRDEGIGIPEEDLPSLFEAFRRGSNVGQTPGTGLGLVIVKQSVELHRGDISVETRQGAGTTFTVTIPLS